MLSDRIPIPQYLQHIAAQIEGNDDHILFSLTCTCGNPWFSVLKNCLSADEQSRLIPYEKACKKLTRGIWGATVTTDDAGNPHHWKLMTPFGLNGWKKEIILPPMPIGSQISVVKCRCLQCRNEHILFDSRRHGYDGIFFEKTQEIMDYAPSFQQLQAKCKLEIKVCNDPIDEDIDFSIDDYSNGFDWITVFAVSETGKRSVVFDDETG